jgi:hypothetical protein
VGDSSQIRLQWRKSTASGLNGCVEVAADGNTVLVRDSKDPTGPVLGLTTEQWTRFLDLTKQGIGPDHSA